MTPEEQAILKEAVARIQAAVDGNFYNHHDEDGFAFGRGLRCAAKIVERMAEEGHGYSVVHGCSDPACRDRNCKPGRSQ